MHVLVVGGGIIGLMSALELSRAGCQVTVLDQQQHGRAASWAGGGILSPLYPWRYNAAVNRLAHLAPMLYNTLALELLESTGIDIEVSRCGMLMLDVDDHRDALAWSIQEGNQHAEMLGRSAIQRINPRLNSDFQQGLWHKDVANVRNPHVIKALIKHLEKNKVKLAHSVQIIDYKRQGQSVSAVIDQHGQTWSADHIVIACGAWSGLLAQKFALPLPVRPIKGQMILYKTPPRWLPTMLMSGNSYLIPRLDGHILCGSTLEDTDFDDRTDPEALQLLRQKAEKIAPELAKMSIKQQWAGLRPASPNGVPYIGRAPNFDNLWVNAGHFRNGIVLAPASARLLREQLLDQRSSINITPYQFSERLVNA